MRQLVGRSCVLDAAEVIGFGAENEYIYIGYGYGVKRPTIYAELRCGKRIIIYSSPKPFECVGNESDRALNIVRSEVMRLGDGLASEDDAITVDIEGLDCRLGAWHDECVTRREARKAQTAEKPKRAWWR